MSHFNFDRAAKINLALALAGMFVWILISLMTDRREAWDSEVFWSLGVPLMMALNAVTAFLDPNKVAVKGIVSVALQPAAMMVQAGEIGSMFPMGLVVFAFLGLFYSIGGVVGAYVKRQFFTTQESDR